MLLTPEEIKELQAVQVIIDGPKNPEPLLSEIMPFRLRCVAAFLAEAERPDLHIRDSDLLVYPTLGEPGGPTLYSVTWMPAGLTAKLYGGQHDGAQQQIPNMRSRIEFQVLPDGFYKAARAGFPLPKRTITYDLVSYDSIRGHFNFNYRKGT